MEASAADEDGEEGGGGGEEVSEVLEAEDIEELGGAEGEISWDLPDNIYLERPAFKKFFIYGIRTDHLGKRKITKKY